MNYVKLLIIGSLFTLSGAANADDHAGNSGPGVAEFWNCTLKEGHTLDEIRQLSSIVEQVNKDTIKGKVGQWIFQPFAGGDIAPGRFVLMTAWPSFAEMGKGFEAWFGQNVGAEGMQVFGDAAVCQSRTIATIEEQFNAMD